jgi:antirestriction protein ArdC
VRQAVTDRIIAMLAQGGHVARARWVAAASRGFPRNLHTGRCYRGANVLLLWDEAIAQGHATNLWMTYRQAAMLGGQVRRGARGVMCAHFDRVPGRPARDEAHAGVAGERTTCGVGEDEGEGEGLESARVGVLRCRPFWLFNLAQVDGLPDDLGMAACEGAPAWAGPMAGEGRGAVETALRLVAGCDAVVRHGFGVASYVPVRDEIRLQLPKRFASAENYCATLLHELVHWTGHPARLHRAFGPRFGDAAPAFEALVAELGSAFLMGHCGLVQATIEGHTGCLEAWLQLLRHDRSAIFTAARHASDAFDWILARGLPEVEDLR